MTMKPMKNFRMIMDGVDVRRFLDEIDSITGAWERNTGRQDKIAVQREAQAIPLRGLVKSKINGRERRDVHESRFTTSSERFVRARRFLEEFAAGHHAEMGRARIVRLMPGRRVYPHIDRGEYYRVRDRYHLILQSPAGSYMKCGEEEIRMREGELWWFDNNVMHEAYNDGELERIHIIFDMLPLRRRAEVYGSGAGAGATPQA